MKRSVHGVDFDIKHIDAREFLEEYAFAFHNRFEANEPRFPSPRIAVPLEITATRLPYWCNGKRWRGHRRFPTQEQLKVNMQGSNQ